MTDQQLYDLSHAIAKHVGCRTFGYGKDEDLNQIANNSPTPIVHLIPPDITEDQEYKHESFTIHMLFLDKHGINKTAVEAIPTFDRMRELVKAYLSKLTSIGAGGVPLFSITGKVRYIKLENRTASQMGGYLIKFELFLINPCSEEQLNEQLSPWI